MLRPTFDGGTGNPPGWLEPPCPLSSYQTHRSSASCVDCVRKKPLRSNAMNTKTSQLIHRTVKHYTAFKSFDELVTVSLAHRYTPTISPWKLAPVRIANAFRALSRQYDIAMEATGSHLRAYPGSDATSVN